ncbi:MAG: hypothetical protein HC828_02440 [Blastochloris sp.]|nr:hypothetical protein [Blastochloris sp.]
MDNHHQIHCANCGTNLAATTTDGSNIICPVCQFANAPGVSSPGSDLTLEAFATRLGDLLAEARFSNLLPEDIVHVLRDELEFAAELANRGRDLYVQIVDLGPRRGEPVRRMGGDNSPLLRGRTVGA